MIVLTLGEKIKAKRKEKNMTLKDLAGDRITQGQISLVESGKSNPSIYLLEYLGDRLNTEVEYFLESEEKQATRISEFYISIAESHEATGDYDLAVEAVEKGLVFTKKYNLSFLKGILEFIGANVKFLKGEYEEAQQDCLSANSIFLRSDNIEYTIKSFILLGNLALSMGYANTALNYFMHGEAILKESNYIGELLLVQIYYNISICLNKMNDNDKAVEYAELVNERLQELNNKTNYAEKFMKLSIDLSEENNIVEALNYAKKAQKIYDELKEVHEKANMETNLGVIFSKGNKTEEAFLHFDNAIKLKKEIKDKTLADTILKMCECLIEINEYCRALEMVNNVIKLIAEDQYIYHIKCLELQFNIFNKMGEKNQAEKTLQRGIKYLEKLDYKKQLGDFYSILGKFYVDSNDKELALLYINKGIELYKELGIIDSDDQK